MDGEEPSGSQPAKRRKTFHEENSSRYLNMLTEVEAELSTEDLEKLVDIAKHEDENFRFEDTGVQPNVLANIGNNGLFTENDLSWLEAALMKVHTRDAANIVCNFAYGKADSDHDFPSEPESSNDGEEDDLPKTFEDLLECIGLVGKHYNKLTLQEFLIVRDCSTNTSLMHTFWQKITSLDHRIVLSQNLLPENISMRDFIFSLLHCSDDFLRQDILEKLSACQLAVPFLLQGVREKKPEILGWACRRIVKKWQGQDDSISLEKSIITHPTFTVAILRIGDVYISKSQILNRMLSLCQGYDLHHFFLNSESDKVKPKYSLGTVESVWFLPRKGTEKETIKNVTTFLNLRGDCKAFPIQTEFCCKTADLTITFVSEVNKVDSEGYVRNIKSASNKSLFIDVTGKETNIPDMRPLLNSQSILVGETQINCLEQNLCEFVSQCYRRGKAYGTLENVTKISDSDIDFDDAKNENQNARKLIKDIFQSIQFKSCLEFKKKCFPLQESWQEWVQIDRTRFDSENIREDWSFEKHREKTNTGKKHKRETQLQNHFSQTMKIFYNGIKDTENNFARSQYIFCFLYDKIQELVSEDTTKTMTIISNAENKDSEEVNWSDLQEAVTSCENKDASHSTNQNIDDKTNDVVLKKIRCGNLGSEHFLREMGQLYEAYMDIYDKHALSKETADIPLFPSIATSLALQMHPFELMDGDTGFVPITWITAVLDKMTEHLQDPRVLVISVVGVQSSGKSTLLNSMFGLRFPVRAGRCTRGLFARFLKIEEKLAKELGFKYVIIVDTEGIKSIDHDDHRFDNELVTFALSIANVTIFNISGENIGPDVAGILQIAAHALMRMKEVDLECRCKIVQQRVSDLTAADRNKGSADKIKETLDEATKFAAEEEGLEGRYKEFSDVVDLKFDEDLQYVPSLWTGGMAPPNHMYGEKVIKIKRGLLQDVRNKIINPDLTLSTFTDRVRDVWSAVKEENFVFKFKDSVRAVDLNQFCLYYNEWIVQMRQAIMDKSNGCLRGVKSAVEKGNSVESLIPPLEDEVERQSELLRDLVEKYVLNHPRKSMISRHKRGFLEDVHIAVKDARQQAQQGITEEYEIKKLEHNLPNLGPKWLVRMITDVKEVASTTAVTEELPHENIFDVDRNYPRSNYVYIRNEQELYDLWKKWTKEIKQESGITQIQISPSDIKTLCDKLLLRMTRDMAIGSDIHNLLSKEGGIEKHIELSDCSKYINDKQVKGWIRNRATTLKEDKGPSERESETPENEIIQKEKQKAINTMIQSIKSSIDELKSQNRKHFDRNVFQLLVRKTLKNLSKKTEGDIKLPNSLIAKGLMHLCGRAFNEVFQYTTVSDDNYSSYFYWEDYILRQTFGSLITQSDVEYNIADILYYYIKIELRKKYEHFMKNLDYSKLTKRLSLPWDVLEYESRHVIERDWFSGLFYEPMFDIMAWSARYCEFLMSTDSDGIEMKEIDRLLVTVLDDLAKLENNLNKPVSYQDWIDRLLETFNIDSSVRCTYDIYDNPCPLEVFRHLKELINKWDSREEYDYPRLDRSSLKIAAGLSNVCKETCPMCGMFCDNIMKSHTIHSSHLHRPRGVARETYPGTNRLVLEDCSSSILLADAMCTITGEDFLCKDYKQCYPDWEIRPSTNDPGKLFWQWILVESALRGYHILSLDKFPTSWRNITKENALKSLIDDKQLKTEMRTNQNQHTKDDNDEQKLVAEDVSDSEESTEAGSASCNSPSEDEPERSSDDESEVVQS
ncbi:interferon-induced very large GTPase 1-like [Apostichopus japonicus]|uniref:interferon-induced very large GTPase 1-like n=1 Tax=Stichopus japonicus TaxID=307972 RepID=UPI003AB84333